MKTFIENLFFYALVSCVILSLGCSYKLRNNLPDFLNQTIAISIENNPLNLNFVNSLKKENLFKKVIVNQNFEDADLSIKILEHKITRFSAAIGVGARTREARLEYYLKISINKKKQKEDQILEIRDSSVYSFDESRILAIEEIEERLKENFFKNALNRINFFLWKLPNEDI